jgi:NADPH-dependent curcumin reductase CurA
MKEQINRRWLIQDRPIGRALRDSDFRLESAPVGVIGDGQVMVRTLCLSFDPALKSWMENIAGYAEPTEIGGLMPGSGIGQVIESRAAGFTPGDLVVGQIGWQEIAIVAASKLEPVPADAPPASALSVLGLTGRTAYFGLLEVGKPHAGDTLVISGAAGAVGSAVGQIGKIAGCRVVGIAGGAAKCAWLTEELGFDAAIDYKSEKLRSCLRELCPAGIDIVFDNVGGDVLNDCLARLTFGARVVICGGIARYNADPRDPGQMPPGPRNYFNVVFTQATIQGFLVHHFADRYPVADARLKDWLRQGLIVDRQDMQTGLENAPRTLMRLFDGANRGKQLLKIAEAANAG